MLTMRLRTVLLTAVTLLWMGGLTTQAYGVADTTTSTLTAVATTVLEGSPVQLTATIVSSGAALQDTGLVHFCDAAAPRCEGASLLGVQQAESGVASISLVLGAGTHNINAVFLGYNGVTGSTSATLVITVTAQTNYTPAMTMVPTGTPGNYTLTATVVTSGTTPPSGTVSFLDTSNANAVVATGTLDPLTLARTIIVPPGSPITSQAPFFWVTSGDFNKDGIADLAVIVTGGSGSLDIFLGGGDGTFQAPVNYSVGSQPIMAVVSNFSNDSNLQDLVVVNSADNTVSVLEGLPNGTFGTAQALATGINPVSAVVGDFNGDGYTDIAVANNNNGGAGTVSVILGNPGGDEFFAGQVTYPVDAGPIGLVTGDFNGDGILDLVTTNEASSTLSVLLGVGDGTFAAAITTPLPTGAQASFLSTADLRNNGTLDLVMATPNAPDVYVLLGNNDGTFQAAVDYPMGAGALSVAVGDLNGDGILDLAVPDLNTGAVSTKLGNGDGTFGASSTVMIGPGTFHLELADLNGDGLLDYVVADPNTATVSIALQAHTETAIAAGVAVTGAGAHDVLASYAGDAERVAGVSATVPLQELIAVASTSVVTVTPNPPAAGQAVTITVTITPSPAFAPYGTVSFYDGTTLLGTVSVNAAGTASFTTATLQPGDEMITAVYSGSASVLGSTSPAVVVTVTTAYTMSASATPFSVGQGGSVAVPITIAPLGVTFTGAVTLSATGLPPGATATFAPASVTPGTTGAQTVMTVKLVAAAISLPQSDPRMWYLLLGLLLAVCGIVLAKFNAWRPLRWGLATAGLAFAMVMLAGCGRESSPTTAVTTQKGSYTVNVTGTSGALTATTTVTVVVN